MQIKTTTKHVIEVTIDELIDAIRQGQVHTLNDDVELRIVEGVNQQGDPYDHGWIDIPRDWEKSTFPYNLDEGTDIQVRLREGGTIIGSVGEFEYSQRGADYDIIAYRVIK